MPPFRTGVLILHPDATDAETKETLLAVGSVHGRPTIGDGWAAVPVGDGVRDLDVLALAHLPGVERVVCVEAPYRIASREVFKDPVPIRISRSAGVEAFVGGHSPITLFVGSRWALGSDGRLQVLAPLLKESGCCVLHAGRLNGSGHDPVPGVDEGTLARLRATADEHGLLVSVEVADPTQLDIAHRYADVLQVGGQNMQDFGLLRDLGAVRLPVILRRGPGATVEEFLLAAEYILSYGNGRVILCESGIRTFDAVRKPRFEINALPLLKMATHLPVIADPSWSTDHPRLVPSVARAAVAAGADGLMLEVGTEAVVDKEGSAIEVVTLRRLMTELEPVARAVGRSTAERAANEARPPTSAQELLRVTDRTLGVAIASMVGTTPDLEVVGQWRIPAPVQPWLSGSLSSTSDVLARCTSYRLGEVRLSRNLAYVDLGRIDPTIAVLLESGQLNLGQLFLDTRIEKKNFEFGTDVDAGPIAEVFRARFPDEADELRPYVWRRYEGAIEGRVVFVVIESLPVATWDRIFGPATPVALEAAR